MSHRQFGFGAAPIIALVIVVGVIGLIGYTLWQRNTDLAVTNTIDQQAVDAAPTIKNKEDLDTALRTLDNTDIAGKASQDIDTESNF